MYLGIFKLQITCILITYIFHVAHTLPTELPGRPDQKLFDICGHVCLCEKTKTKLKPDQRSLINFVGLL